MTLRLLHDRAEIEHVLVTLHAEGQSIRSLSRRFGMGRNRVRKILRRNQRQRDEGHTILPVMQRRGSILDGHMPRIQEILTAYPRISAVRVREELALEGYHGGLSILRQRLHELRSTPSRIPVIRFETDPGVQGQMDWSPYTIDFTREGRRDVLAFSYILGYSRRQFIDFVDNHRFHTLIRRHVDTFTYFDGVTLECLYDNEKTVVLRWEAGHPIFNPAFIDFITHYRCKPIACKPGSPKTKGKIERPFGYVEGNFLSGRTFIDMIDLRSRASVWLTDTSDTHVHETTGRPPLELFMEREKAALQPLPLHQYDCSEVALRVCSGEGFIEFKANVYSLPFDYIGDIVTVKATEREVFIYSPFIDLIATHERFADGAGCKSENPAHRHSPKARYGLEPVRESFLRLGDAATAFLDGLIKLHPRNCGLHARLILQLKEQYLAADIEKACAHATRYHAFDAGAIGRILKARARPRTLESIRNENARQALATLLPAIPQRSLEEYSLLNKTEDVNEQKGDQQQDQGPSQDTQAAQNRDNP